MARQEQQVADSGDHPRVCGEGGSVGWGCGLVVQSGACCCSLPLRASHMQHVTCYRARAEAIRQRSMRRQQTVHHPATRPTVGSGNMLACGCEVAAQ